MANPIAERRQRILQGSVNTKPQLPPRVETKQQVITAKILTELTKEILFEYSKKWILAKSPNCNIQYLTGNGYKTFCMYNSNLTSFKIQYGERCIGDHFLYHKIGYWTHFHELIRFNLSRNTITLIYLLSAVAIHEFSHLIAALHPESYKYNGAHHKLFFDVLVRIHKNGITKSFKFELAERLKSEQINLSFTCGRIEIPKGVINYWGHMRSGDNVLFVKEEGTERTISEGRILKVKSKNIDVKTSFGRISMPKYGVFSPEYF